MARSCPFVKTPLDYDITEAPRESGHYATLPEVRETDFGQGLADGRTCPLSTCFFQLLVQKSP